jgi:predicted RNase H-like nuclease (RuvC/YqgF family)
MSLIRLQIRGTAVCALIVSLLLGACATDAQRTRGEAAAVGAAAGAAVFAMAGHNRDSAIVGGVIGGIVGAVVGDRKVETKARYAQREDELRASAERATAVANASREQNAQLMRDIAALDQSVQSLRTASASAEHKQAQAAANQKKLRQLLASVDQQLHQMREEISRQSALAKAASDAQAKGGGGTSSEGIQLVSTGVRDLTKQARTLELAKLQLQQIDRRRAY